MTKRTYYEITIERIDVEDVSRGAEWKVVADTGNERDGKSVYEYVQPPGTEERTTRSTVYVQQIPSLDMKAVIYAVQESSPDHG